MKRMTPTEAKVMAMAIDCEGTIVLHRAWSKKQGKHYYQPIIQIGNGRKELIDYFQVVFPGRTITYVVHRKPTHCDMWLWHVVAGDIPSFIQQIRPHLITKQAQADIILRFYNECYKQPRIGQRWVRCQKRIKGDEVLVLQERLYNLIRALNSGHDHWVH